MWHRYVLAWRRQSRDGGNLSFNPKFDNWRISEFVPWASWEQSNACLGRLEAWLQTVFDHKLIIISWSVLLVFAGCFEELLHELWSRQLLMEESSSNRAEIAALRLPLQIYCISLYIVQVKHFITSPVSWGRKFPHCWPQTGNSINIWDSLMVPWRSIVGIRRESSSLQALHLSQFEAISLLQDTLVLCSKSFANVDSTPKIKTASLQKLQLCQEFSWNLWVEFIFMDVFDYCLGANLFACQVLCPVRQGWVVHHRRQTMNINKRQTDNLEKQNAE